MSTLIKINNNCVVDMHMENAGIDMGEFAYLPNETHEEWQKRQVKNAHFKAWGEELTEEAYEASKQYANKLNEGNI